MDPPPRENSIELNPRKKDSKEGAGWWTVAEGECWLITPYNRAATAPSVAPTAITDIHLERRQGGMERGRKEGGRGGTLHIHKRGER